MVDVPFLNLQVDALIISLLREHSAAGRLMIYNFQPTPWSQNARGALLLPTSTSLHIGGMPVCGI